MALTDEGKAVVSKAIELLEKGWCQRAFAKDQDGNQVPVDSPDACTFCTLGALIRAGLEINPDTTTVSIHQLAFYEITDALRAHTDSHSIAGFNDLAWTKKDDVISLLKRIL